MKSDIHPTYYAQTKVRCACGNEFAVGSTVDGAIETEVCSNCHPFYTGQEKVLDAAGRVERFRQIVAKGKTIAAEKGNTKERKATKRAVKKAKDESKAK